MTTYNGRDFWSAVGTSWRVAPLRRMAALGTGHTPSRSHAEYWEACTIPWVTTEDLTRREDSDLAPLMDTRQKISQVGLENSAAVLHPTDTVMLSRTASVGHVVRIGKPMATTQAFATWTCGPSLYPRFLVLALKAMEPEIRRIAYGSTHLTIYMPDIEQLRVPVPPVPVQRAIADYVDTEVARIDALIANKRILLKALRERENALVSELWEEATDRWGTTRLGRLLVRMEQGWSPQCEDRLAEPSEYGVVKAGCVNGGHFRANQHKALPQDVSPRLEYLLRPGDLLVSRASGSLDLIGSAAVVPEGAPSNLILCDKVYRLATDMTTDSRYVALMLRAHRVRELIKLGVSGGDGMANNLPSGVIRGLPIPVAPLLEQRKIVARAHQVESETTRLAASLNESVAALYERRQALITAAVTGELEIPGVA